MTVGLVGQLIRVSMSVSELVVIVGVAVVVGLVIGLAIGWWRRTDDGEPDHLDDLLDDADDPVQDADDSGFQIPDDRT